MASEEVEYAIVSFRCPPDLKAKLDRKVASSGETLSKVLLAIVEGGISDETVSLKPGELRMITRGLQIAGMGLLARKLQLRRRSP
jgi:hypothetical protein